MVGDPFRGHFLRPRDVVLYGNRIMKALDLND